MQNNNLQTLSKNDFIPLSYSDLNFFGVDGELFQFKGLDYIFEINELRMMILQSEKYLNNRETTYKLHIQFKHYPDYDFFLDTEQSGKKIINELQHQYDFFKHQRQDREEAIAQGFIDDAKNEAVDALKALKNDQEYNKALENHSNF